MKTEILLRPLVTEKMTSQQEKLGKYGFIVNVDANKIEIKKAIENLDIMHLSGKEREYYENDLKRMLSDKASLQTAKLKGREEGIQEGLQQGVQKGKQEEKFDVARRMLAKGNSVEDAAEIAGLSVEKVSKLRQ